MVHACHVSPGGFNQEDVEFQGRLSHAETLKHGQTVLQNPMWAGKQAENKHCTWSEGFPEYIMKLF